MGPMPSVDDIGAPICSMVKELERDANLLSDVFRASLEDDVGTSKGHSQAVDIVPVRLHDVGGSGTYDGNDFPA